LDVVGEERPEQRRSKKKLAVLEGYTAERNKRQLDIIERWHHAMAQPKRCTTPWPRRLR